MSRDIKESGSHKDIIIRDDNEKYMQELKQWLAETKDTAPEEMSSFFENRLTGYEEHMMVWEKAYRRFAELLPEKKTPDGREDMELLDLGCGTGLELDEIWKRRPEVAVTGVDLCREMLAQLEKKHRDKKLTIVCEDYFKYDFGQEKWDAAVSFESLHHFLPDQKLVLYRKIYNCLKKGGSFLLGDYIANCEEEESLLRQVYLEKRKQFAVPEGQFVHFDIPLTLEHETELLRQAGFREIRHVECVDGATILLLDK